jgi:ABC-type polysaccharide/polyol phosphate transport system ATPase subunit
MTIAITARDVRKVYRRYGRRKQFATLKSALLSGRLFSDLRPEDSFEALRGVSFDVLAGQTFGIVGRNGSGKSTMLKLIAGIGKPTSGAVAVDGRVSALIELGAGFHPEIPGRENVFINGMMLGLTRREVDDRFAEIVQFAEIEDFIDEPVKTYSSGMYMRLGFSVAIHVDPDVLLVDEVLAVGDEAFTHKCLDKFAEFRRRGKTVLIVTHSLDLVTRFCDKALWLDGGVIREKGDPQRVIDAYLLDVAQTEEQTLQSTDRQSAARVEAGVEMLAEAPPTEERHGEPAVEDAGGVTESDESVEPADMFQAVEGRWGSREAEIVEVGLLRADGHPTQVFASGDALEIRLRVRAEHALDDVVFGVGIFDADGVCCYGTNTQIDGADEGTLEGEGEVSFFIEHLDLVASTYKLDVAVHRVNGGAPYDYHRQLHTIRVTSRLKDVGIYRPPHRWAFSGGVSVKGLG